jgi:hypothetical protein
MPTRGGEQRLMRYARLAVGALMLVLRLSAAPAQPLSPPEPFSASGRATPEQPRPWAAGVSESEQALALEIYVAGNAEFAESRFAQALAKYRDAVTHWDHPAIRFNIAVCLINLGQPIEAREQLEKGLAFGIPPLGPEAHAQAITYRKLLDAQLTRLTISCPEPGAQVTLDGKPLLTGPGSATRYLLPGEHQVVATKPGMQASLQTLILTAGTPAAVELRPAIERAARPQMVRRWATWKPWAVLGSGGGFLGLGALSYFTASGDFAAYDRGVAARCPAGCSAAMLAEYGLADKKQRAEREQVIAVSLFAVGGCAVVAGVVGLLLNQPRVKLEARPVPLTIAPVAGGAVIATAWGF